MAGNAKAFTSRLPEYIIFVLLFLALPAFYLDGIHQLEFSLKMPLLAVILAIQVICVWITQGKTLRNESFASMRSRKFVLFFILLLSWMGILVNKSINPADALVEVARWVLLFLFLVTNLVYLDKHPMRRQLFLSGPSLAILVWAVYGSIQLGAGFFLAPESEPFRIDFSIGSTLGNKNSFAEALLLALPFALYGWKTSKGKILLLHATAVLVSIFFLFFLKSLATWVAAGSGLVFYLLVIRHPLSRFFSFKSALRILSVAVLLVVSAGVIQRGFKVDSVSRKMQLIPSYLHNETMFQKNDKANNNSIFERLLLWRNTSMMIRENPVTGAGINNWKILLYKYGIIGTDFISTGLVHYEHPHNDYLLMLAECGGVGLLLFILLFYFLFREGMAILGRQQDPLNRQLAACMLTVLVFFLVLSLFGYPWFKIMAPVLLLISVAVLFSLDPVPALERSLIKTSIPVFFYVFALLTSAFVFYASTQRLRGEAMMYAVQDAKYKRNWPKIIRILKTDLPFFKMDAVATPVDWHRGIACYYSGDIPGAKEYFLRAEPQHPYHLQLLNDLGSISEMEGNHERALDYYSRALQVAPLNIPARLNKSAVYFNMKQADSAFVTLDPVYGNKLSGQDRERYEKTVGLVLYAKAYLLVRQAAMSQQPALFNRINDKRMLRRAYIESKKNNKSFGEQLFHSLDEKKSPG